MWKIVSLLFKMPRNCFKKPRESGANHWLVWQPVWGRKLRSKRLGDFRSQKGKIKGGGLWSRDESPPFGWVFLFFIVLYFADCVYFMEKFKPQPTLFPDLENISPKPELPESGYHRADGSTDSNRWRRNKVKTGKQEVKREIKKDNND